MQSIEKPKKNAWIIMVVVIMIVTIGVNILIIKSSSDDQKKKNTPSEWNKTLAGKKQKPNKPGWILMFPDEDRDGFVIPLYDEYYISVCDIDSGNEADNRSVCFKEYVDSYCGEYTGHERELCREKETWFFNLKPSEQLLYVREPAFDCDDENSLVCPTCPELPDDGLDNNCDGYLAEGECEENEDCNAGVVCNKTAHRCRVKKTWKWSKDDGPRLW